VSRTVSVVVFLAALALAGLVVWWSAADEELSMNTLAERYVRLVLAVGQHDADYVDAYYGPPEWRKQAEAAKIPLAELSTTAG
jgi:hypothetical protein